MEDAVTETEHGLPLSAPDDGASWLTIGGWIFLLAGAAATAWSLFMQTTIPVDALAEATARLNGSIAGYTPPLPTGGTYNIGLLQQQMIVFQGGIAACVIGAIFLVGGLIDVRSRAARPHRAAENVKIF